MQNSFNNPICNPMLPPSKSGKKGFIRISNMHYKQLLAVEEKKLWLVQLVQNFLGFQFR